MRAGKRQKIFIVWLCGLACWWKLASFGLAQTQARDTNQLLPTWSPDGKYYACVEWREQTVKVVIYEAEKQKPKKQAAVGFKDSTGFNVDYFTGGVETEVVNFFDWAHDSKHYVFLSTSAIGYDLFVGHVDENETWRLTEDSETELMPRWSPDDRYIVFVKAGDLYAIELEKYRKKDEPGRLTFDADIPDLYPEWNLESKMREIAFSRFAGERAGASYDIALYNSGAKDLIFSASAAEFAANKKLIRLRTRNGASHELHPTFSPDGQNLAYYVIAKGEVDYFIYSLPKDGAPGQGSDYLGERLSSLPVLPSMFIGPSWSFQNDKIGFKIAFVENRLPYYPIHVVDVATHEEDKPRELEQYQDLRSGYFQAADVAFAPKDYRLAFIARNAKTSLTDLLVEKLSGLKPGKKPAKPTPPLAETPPEKKPDVPEKKEEKEVSLPKIYCFFSYGVQRKLLGNVTATVDRIDPLTEKWIPDNNNEVKWKKEVNSYLMYETFSDHPIKFIFSHADYLSSIPFVFTKGVLDTNITKLKTSKFKIMKDPQIPANQIVVVIWFHRDSLKHKSASTRLESDSRNLGRQEQPSPGSTRNTGGQPTMTDKRSPASSVPFKGKVTYEFVFKDSSFLDEPLKDVSVTFEKFNHKEKGWGRPEVKRKSKNIEYEVDFLDSLKVSFDKEDYLPIESLIFSRGNLKSDLRTSRLKNIKPVTSPMQGKNRFSAEVLLQPESQDEFESRHGLSSETPRKTDEGNIDPVADAHLNNVLLENQPSGAEEKKKSREQTTTDENSKKLTTSVKVYFILKNFSVPIKPDSVYYINIIRIDSDRNENLCRRGPLPAELLKPIREFTIELHGNDATQVQIALEIGSDQKWVDAIEKRVILNPTRYERTVSLKPLYLSDLIPESDGKPKEIELKQ